MPTQIKSKEQKAIAAANASKGKKKKWKSLKLKEKASNSCLFSEELYKKVLDEAQKFKVISTYVMVDRFNINGSLARSVIRDLVQKNLIKPVVVHRGHCIYSRLC